MGVGPSNLEGGGRFEGVAKGYFWVAKVALKKRRDMLAGNRIEILEGLLLRTKENLWQALRPFRLVKARWRSCRI